MPRSKDLLILRILVGVAQGSLAMSIGRARGWLSEVERGVRTLTDEIVDAVRTGYQKLGIRDFDERLKKISQLE